MVGVKSASLAVLLGSAALSSAVAVPKTDDHAARLEGKRMWRGRLGARGPWRNQPEPAVHAQNVPAEQDRYLINIDLSGDGEQRHGLGSLIDINTRDIADKNERALLSTPFDPLTSAEKQKELLKFHFGSHGGGGARASIPVLNLADLRASLQTALHRRAASPSAFLDIAATLGASLGKREWEQFAQLAASLGVSADDIAAAKKAAGENMTAEQQADVQNAVKHALWSSRHHGERGVGGEGAVPGPAFLFKMRDVEEEEEEDVEEGHGVLAGLLNVDAKIKVLGEAPQSETGVMSTESSTTHGQPLLVVGGKRSVEDDMGGAPGYIDITSPVHDSEAQRIASLVLSTTGDSDSDSGSDGKDAAASNSSFVLNASSNIRTQVYLVPLNTDVETPPGGGLIRVNLKVPVFVADTATVEPYCATFDPSPEAPSPMTVEPCDEAALDGEKSQVFLFDPETGVVKPEWKGLAAESVSDGSSAHAESAQSASASASASTSTLPAPIATSSDLSSASASISSAIASASSALPSPSSPASADFAAKAASAGSSSVSSVVAPAASSIPGTASAPAPSTPVQAYPSESASRPALPSLPAALAAAAASSASASAPASLVHSLTSAVPSASRPASASVPTHSSVSNIKKLAASSAPASASAPAHSIISAPASVPIPAPASASASATASSVSGSISAQVPLPSTNVSAAAAAAPELNDTAPAPADSVHGNNVTLIFTPSHASVSSKDKAEGSKDGSKADGTAQKAFGFGLTPSAPASAPFASASASSPISSPPAPAPAFGEASGSGVDSPDWTSPDFGGASPSPSPSPMDSPVFEDDNHGSESFDAEAIEGNVETETEGDDASTYTDSRPASSFPAEAEGEVLDGEYDAANAFDDEAEGEEVSENDLYPRDGAEWIEVDCDDLGAMSTPAPGAGTKAATKPKQAKLPEGSGAGDSQKVSLSKGGVAVEDMGSLRSSSKNGGAGAGAQSVKSRLGARFLRRQQTVMSAPDATAPYAWTWTSVDDGRNKK